MPIAARILATWRDPRAAMRWHLAAGPREDRAIAVLMAAAALGLVAQMPGLWRAAAADPTVPHEARLGAAVFAALFLLPLLAYLLAGLSWGAMRLIRRPVSGFASRIALFWALLAVFPAALAHRTIEALFPPGNPAVVIAGLAAFGGFLYLWIVGLDEARRHCPSQAGPDGGPERRSMPDFRREGF